MLVMGMKYYWPQAFTERLHGKELEGIHPEDHRSHPALTLNMPRAAESLENSLGAVFLVQCRHIVSHMPVTGEKAEATIESLFLQVFHDDFVW